MTITVYWAIAGMGWDGMGWVRGSMEAGAEDQNEPGVATAQVLSHTSHLTTPAANF